jgi:hypothetical protein
MDSNFQYASIERWHRATDLPLPPTKRRSVGPASHGETAFRGAAGFREARSRDAVHPVELRRLSLCCHSVRLRT